MKFLLNLAISCFTSPLAAFAPATVLLRSFNNPAPAIDDNIGSSMPALGNDRAAVMP